MNALLKITVVPLLILAGVWCLIEVTKSNNAQDASLATDLNLSLESHEVASPTEMTPAIDPMHTQSLSLASNVTDDEGWTKLPSRSSSSIDTSIDEQAFVLNASPQETSDLEIEALKQSASDEGWLELPSSVSTVKSARSKPVLSRNLPSIEETPSAGPTTTSLPPLPKIRSLPANSPANQASMLNENRIRSLPKSSSKESSFVAQQSKPQFMKNPHVGAPSSNSEFAATIEKSMPATKSNSIGKLADSIDKLANSMDESTVDDLLAVEPEDSAATASSNLASAETDPSKMKDDTQAGGSFKPVTAMTSTTKPEKRFGSFNGQTPSQKTASSAMALAPPSQPQAFASQPIVTRQVARPGQRPEIAVSARPRTMTTSPVVEEQARDRIAYGKSLARRGSTYTARQEFTQALRMLAESHDMSSKTRQYTTHLANGLRALEEANDFVTDDTRQQLAMEVTTIVEAHGTKLLDSYEATQTSPMEAMQVYYDFAAKQLASAVGQSPAGAEALQSLGKLLTTSPTKQAMGQTRAMVMHQAAMLANPNNPETCNELGVLMARHGQLEKASALFKQSLMVKKSPQTWQNLGKVHQRLAEISGDIKMKKEQKRLSELAYKESRTLAEKMPTAQFKGPMEWVTGEVFESQAAIAPVQGEPVLRTAAAPTKVEKPKAKGVFGNVKKWF